MKFSFLIPTNGRDPPFSFQGGQLAICEEAEE